MDLLNEISFPKVLSSLFESLNGKIQKYKKSMRKILKFIDDDKPGLETQEDENSKEEEKEKEKEKKKRRKKRKRKRRINNEN